MSSFTESGGRVKHRSLCAVHNNRSCFICTHLRILIYNTYQRVRLVHAFSVSFAAAFRRAHPPPRRLPVHMAALRILPSWRSRRSSSINVAATARSFLSSSALAWEFSWRRNSSCVSVGGVAGSSSGPVPCVLMGLTARGRFLHSS